MGDNYDQKIQDDELLSKLLINKEIGMLSTFSRKNYEESFKASFKDLYVESFKEIYASYINTEKEGRITSLVRSVKYLSVPDSKALIVDELLPKLELSVENLKTVKDSLYSEEVMIANSEKFDGAISPIVIGILNEFGDNKKIQEYRDKILTLCFDICDDVSQAKPAKETYKYAAYNVVINNVEKINDFGSLKSRFDKHNKKIEQTRKGIDTRYYFGVAAVVIFIIIRVLARIS